MEDPKGFSDYKIQDVVDFFGSRQKFDSDGQYDYSDVLKNLYPEVHFSND